MIRRPLLGITIAACLNAIPMTILAALAHANFLSLNANGTALVCIASYITVRLGEGIGDPLRQVLLNRLLTKETRSTILSLASMCCMLVSAVGVVAVAGLLALDLSISTVWAGIAVLQVFILPLYAVALNNARKGS
jgi:MFS family permease